MTVAASMKWIDRAEARFGHLAIPNLLRIVAGFNLLVFCLYKLNPSWLGTLTLDREAVMAGEVWRLVSYIFIPQVGSPVADWLFAVLYVWYLWWLGDGLEAAMGSFKVNVFYLLGMIGTTVAAFFFGAHFSTFMLNSSLFFAFARFYPEMTIYFMLVLPVKVKWLAWIYGALLFLGLIGSSIGYLFAVAAALINLIVFFGREVLEEAQQRREVQARRQRFDAERIDASEEALHRCEVCKRTELDEPHLEFRVARDGCEYCVEHLPKPTASAGPQS